MENVIREKDQHIIKLNNDQKELERVKNQVQQYEEKFKLMVEENERFAGLIQDRDKDIERWRTECLSQER